MSNETKDKEKEGDEAPKAEEGFTNIVDRFASILKDFKIKNARVVADHCAKGNLEDLEDIEARMREMNVHPSLVTQVVNFWADEINYPIPQRLRKKMEKESGIKARGSKEESEEKYAVDPETGVIRLAKEGERAVNMVEAQKLQRLIKKDLAEKEEREGGGKKEPAFVSGEKGTWTLNPKAKIGFGEFAVFQMYQDSLRKGEPIDPVEELTKQAEQQIRLKEAMGGKGGGEDTEMGILGKLEKLGMLKKGDDGGLLETIKVLGELGVLKKGEEGRGSDLEVISTLDGLGLLRKPGEEGTTSGLDVMSKLDSLGFLRKPGEEGKGSDLEVISKLDTLGLLRKPGEEGRTSDLEVISRLDGLGLLRKAGEGEGSETIRALEMQIKELKDSLQKQEMDTMKNVVVSLSNQVSDLRKEMSTQGRLEGRYALMEKTITTIDNQLSGLRSDARPVLDTLAHRGGGPGPSKKSPEEKARIAKGLKGAVELEKEAHALEDELVFNVKKD